jgi:hypothetical protein
VGKRLASPVETCLVFTPAGRAPIAAQQSVKDDMISESSESVVDASHPLASLGMPSLFVSRNDDVRIEIDSSAAARRTKQTSRSSDRASRKAIEVRLGRAT